MASVTLKGNPVKLKGHEVKAGESAPDFHGVAPDLSEVSLQDTGNKVRVFSVVPSLDTPVCHVSTKRWNDEVTALGDDVAVYTVSIDTPFAMARWSKAEGADKVKYVSDYRARSFGDAYGCTIADGPLQGALARAIFVVDKSGKVVHAQYVPEIADNPDFDAALEAIKAAAG